MPIGEPPRIREIRESGEVLDSKRFTNRDFFWRRSTFNSGHARTAKAKFAKVSRAAGKEVLQLIETVQKEGCFARNSRIFNLARQDERFA